ncbi:MAG: hypothetical protein CME70_01470 [Halobacteriovorax sp.]|nr:hypothetical protein [Halobacteriovorax sp.]|tara:strand:+ start:79 stop:798 length:720 start_codon:yes stop_codon:yes gene_type:complete
MEYSILVVVPCYNHGQYLEESVKSILNQTHTNLKVTIVNDGSTDNTDEVAQSLINLDDRVSYISFSENKGKWYCLNYAIQESDCNIITSQDADDVSLSDRLERQLLCMLETSTVHNLCGFYHCYNDGDINEHRLKRMTEDVAVMDKDSVGQNVLSGFNHPQINHFFTGDFETAGATAMFFRNIWKLGLRFNPPESGLRVLCSEDSDFNFRVTMLLGHTSVLMEKLYCYRRNTSTNNEKI